jgi:hypothetical protein
VIYCGLAAMFTQRTVEVVAQTTVVYSNGETPFKWRSFSSPSVLLILVSASNRSIYLFHTRHLHPPHVSLPSPSVRPGRPVGALKLALPNHLEPSTATYCSSGFDFVTLSPLSASSSVIQGLRVTSIPNTSLPYLHTCSSSS